jgi:hypothetical protein
MTAIAHPTVEATDTNAVFDRPDTPPGLPMSK